MNGPNELNALNEKLMLHASRGEIRSGQSGLVSTKIDASPSSTTFDVQMSGMAAIFPMDYVRSRLANFESKVYLPEDPGVVQVENFGIHLHANGQVVFGVIVDSVQSHVKDGIPVDLVARLVFDLHEDSSSTLESISSSHQRLLMTSLRSKKSKKVAGADNHASAHGATMSVVDLGARTERRTRRSKKAGGGEGGGGGLLGYFQRLFAASRKRAKRKSRMKRAATRRESMKRGGSGKAGSGEAAGGGALSPSDSAHLMWYSDDSSDNYSEDDELDDTPSKTRDSFVGRGKVMYSSGGHSASVVATKSQFSMFTMFLCEEIRAPTLSNVPVGETPARFDVTYFMDGEDNENEISQITGRVRNAADLPDGGVVIAGEKGIVVSGIWCVSFPSVPSVVVVSLSAHRPSVSI